MLTGPDVSMYQENVDFRKVAKKHELAILKISDGDVRDPKYRPDRVEAVREAGLLFGVYYFARVASPENGQRNGADEAAMAVRFAKAGGWKWPGDLPLMYDFETDNGQSSEKCARHVVQFVRAYRRSQGHHPGIYTFPGLWERILPQFSAQERQLLARCPLWQAEWLTSRPRVLAPWKGPTLWQWTETGRSAGVSGSVDLNRSLVPAARIHALTRRGGAAPPSPVVSEPKPTSDHPADVPSWVPRQHWDKWQRPWEAAAARSAAFRDLLWSHGLVSPHFSRKEAACHDPANTAVPTSLRANAQRQGFHLERLRHELGDKPLPVLSWYRTPHHNKTVDGASDSRHMQADATDFTTQTIASFGVSRFDAACERVYAKGGFGRYASGSRHGDARGFKARW
jgi:GH25 family lysozyme M1 (1,4-beta-N-acetylmuramidase)